MRAPPLAEKQTNGILFFSATLAARTNFSPTTDPIDPAIKLKSKLTATNGKPLTLPCIANKASFSPVVRCAWVRRSL